MERFYIMKDYDHKKIESKWQKIWEKKKIYKTKDFASSKYYVLDMFPYPSGEGLHVGHPKGYIATDVISRFQRMNGKSVLHPMGFDAFGLPAENYAIKTKTNPEIAVKKNVARYKKQLEILGLDYDWSREINTTDPKYYKWTQWIFLQMFKKGLAYQSYEPINWCPSCKTGLANEDVEDGKCERCGTAIEKKPMRQWVLKITDYADRLLKDLDAEDYVMPKIVDETNPHQPGKPLVKRYVAHAIVFDPKTKKYLIIRNKKHGWDTVIIGGIEEGESAVETAIREVREETGYVDIEFKRLLGGQTEGHYYTKHKGENRIAVAQGVYFELKSDKRVPIADGEDKDDEILWVDEKDFVPGKMVNSELLVWLERIKDPKKGFPKPLLEWPENIKEAQRNWIGRSEGALIKFKVAASSPQTRGGAEALRGGGELKINTSPFNSPSTEGERGEALEVFTTRADTFFGVTYVVLAPEHSLIFNLKSLISNWNEVDQYIKKSKQKTEIERTAEDKDTSTGSVQAKTGVEIKGIKAINPANGEEVPVFVADYVLGDYGTGAVMAVPAHDERDFAFAKKYNLPIKNVVAPIFVWEGDKGAWRKNEPEVLRPTVACFIKHWSEEKYLFLRKKEDSDAGRGAVVAVAGGIDEGENLAEAGGREILEETGYRNAKFIKKLGTPIYFRFYSTNSQQNRIAELHPVYFELKNGEKEEISEREKNLHDSIWLTEDNLKEFFETRPFSPIFWKRLKGEAEVFVDSGILVNSGKFDGMKSEEAVKKITEEVGGRMVTKYKLRDWVFSRQRYWGEPIPLVFCENCKKRVEDSSSLDPNPYNLNSGWVSVPEKDLPVKLPKVKNYEPTGTGESPLASIAKWVNVKCPKCKGKAKRETNTMPQWAGSSWYYLRYEDPKNNKKLVDPKKEKYWSPVDFYVGGAEHATRHLIYARFWHKFLYDIGAVGTIEPFRKLQSVGLIMGSDGRKMSKRFGNVINPDDIVEKVGADSLRVYEMFMGPFDQTIAWSLDGVAGTRRFLEKVWRLKEKFQIRNPKSETKPENSKSQIQNEEQNPKLEILLNQTIKKVGEDIEGMRFNTAVSQMMILANAFEKEEEIPQKFYEKFLRILAPFAPHITEELWNQLGYKKSIHLEPWPEYDVSKLQSDTIRIMVQVNGKVRDSFSAERGIGEEDAKKQALNSPNAKKWIDGKEIKKTIYIKDKLVSFVI